MCDICKGFVPFDTFNTFPHIYANDLDRNIFRVIQFGSKFDTYTCIHNRNAMIDHIGCRGNALCVCAHLKKVIYYQNQIYDVYLVSKDLINKCVPATMKIETIFGVLAIDKCKQINLQTNLEDQLVDKNKQIAGLETQLAEKDRVIMVRTNLNKRLVDTLILYKHKQSESPTYDYTEIRSRKQKLHAEFKRLSKLMKLC